MTKRFLIALAACLVAVSGCNLVYKQNVQQGNSLEQEDLDQLRLGMSQTQVAFLLGTPSIRDPFHHDRWDYVSSFSRRGGEAVMRKVTLMFEDGALVNMLGVDNEFAAEEGVADESTSDLPEAPGIEATEEPVAVAPVTAGNSPVQNAGTTPQPEGAATEGSTAVAGATAGMEDDPIISSESQMSSAPGEATSGAAVIAATEAARVATGTALDSASEQAHETPTSADGTAAAWTIQLGAFELRENAENLLTRLDEAGFACEILMQNLQGIGARYLVRLGGLASRVDAEAALEEIDSTLGIIGFIVPSSWPAPE